MRNKKSDEQYSGHVHWRSSQSQTLKIKILEYRLYLLKRDAIGIYIISAHIIKQDKED